jgi:hypothetical protein
MLNSLRCLGLDPHSFRVVHEDEMTENDDVDFHHSDGSVCHCQAECHEFLETSGYFETLEDKRHGRLNFDRPMNDGYELGTFVR